MGAVVQKDKKGERMFKSVKNINMLWALVLN